MELNTINNNIDLNVRSDYYSPHKVESIDNNNISETSGVKSDIVSLDQNFSNDSNIAQQIKEEMNQLVEVQKIQNRVQEQLETVTKLELIIKNEPQLDNAQKPVVELIDQYNTRSKQIYSNLTEMFKEQKSDDSSMYFDGVLGSIPMSAQEINQEILEKKQNLQEINQIVNEKTEQIVNNFEKVMIEEKEVSVEFVKQVDFGKESKDFSNNNLQGIASAVITTQPNPALQSHSLKLLS